MINRFVFIQNKTVNLDSNQSYTAQASNQVIHGSAGVETVTLTGNVTNITIDNEIENVVVASSVFDYRMYNYNNQLVLVSARTGAIVSTIATSTTGTNLIFGDGTQATVSLSATGALQLHYNIIDLLANSFVSLSQSDVVIHGSTGVETVALYGTTVHHVSVDANVEHVLLSSTNYDPANITTSAGAIAIADATGANIATLSTAADHEETLSFQNAVGTLTLDTNGAGVFNLVAINLSANQNFTATNDGITIHGNWKLGSTETVTIGAGLSGERIDANVEKVVFSANHYGDFTFQSNRGILSAYDASGHDIVDIQVKLGNTGTKIQFSDGAIYQANVDNYTGIISLTNIANATSTGTPTTGTSSTGTAPTSPAMTSHFDYTLNYGGSFGNYQTDIQTDLQTALHNIGQYMNALGKLDIQVLPENVSPSVLAETASAMVNTPSILATKDHNANTTSDFQAESQTGIDANGSQYDATVYINMNDISQMNLNISAAPASNQYDMVTVLTHEMLHALGFDGFIGTTSSSTTQTPFDTFVTMQNGTPYFIGANAEAVYGGAVPLAPASAGSGSAYYHVAVANDLMSSSLAPGQVRTISTLDLAILKDCGVPEITLTGTTNAVHIV